jgi:hypothetical protein
VCAACRGDASRVGAAIVTAERHGWRTAARRYFQAYEDIHRQARDTRSVHQKLNFTPKVTHER